MPVVLLQLVHLLMVCKYFDLNAYYFFEYVQAQLVVPVGLRLEIMGVIEREL